MALMATQGPDGLIQDAAHAAHQAFHGRRQVDLPKGAGPVAARSDDWLWKRELTSDESNLVDCCLVLLIGGRGAAEADRIAVKVE